MIETPPESNPANNSPNALPSKVSTTQGDPNALNQKPPTIRVKTNDRDYNQEEESDSEIDIFGSDNDDSRIMNEIIVGPEREYKTIQSAVDAAKGKTIIKVEPGIYRETIQIKAKKDIELTSYDTNDQAIILSENSPCISIYCLEVPDVIKIVNLKFIHRGVRDDLNTGTGDILTSEFFAWHAAQLNNKENVFIYKNAAEIEKLEVNYTLDVKIIENIFIKCIKIYEDITDG